MELTILCYFDDQSASSIRRCYAVSRGELPADYQSGSLRRYLADKGLSLARIYSLIGACLPNREEVARPLIPRHVLLLTVLALPRDCIDQPMELAQSISRVDRLQYQAASQGEPMTTSYSNPTIVVRQRWMGVLARVRRGGLGTHADVLCDAGHHLLRAAETGVTLVRERMDGTGSPFNLGEMTAIRYVVRLADGRTGYNHIAGRDKRHTELAILADARLQSADVTAWQARLIEPPARTQAGCRAAQEAEIATIKTESFTLVRGED